jgi:hypothetical protein
MKMGTTRSPWHYDVVAYITTRQLKMRRLWIPRYELKSFVEHGPRC